MKKLLFVLTLISLSFFANAEGKVIRDSVKFQGEFRHYYVYVPEGVQPDAPIVFYWHGYGGKPEKGPSKLFNATADREKFVVCVPYGAIDPKKRHAWNVGYCFQQGMKTDDAAFMRMMVKLMHKKFNTSLVNVFGTGTSNGGEMSYLMAYQAPDLFRALAPLAGLTMEWMYTDLKVKAPIPLLEIHGTLDHTSEWNGDLTNAGGWGNYIAVPIAVSTWVNANKCTYEITEELPLKTPESHKVILHKYVGSPYGYEVRLYEVVGGGHSNAENDMDTSDVVWDFFKMYLK